MNQNAIFTSFQPVEGKPVKGHISPEEETRPSSCVGARLHLRVSEACLGWMGACFGLAAGVVGSPHEGNAFGPCGPWVRSKQWGEVWNIWASVCGVPELSWVFVRLVDLRVYLGEETVP